MTRDQPQHRLAAGLLAVTVFSFTNEAAAKELTVTVAQGQSLEAIAQHYYGATWKAAYLRTRNRVPRRDTLAMFLPHQGIKEERS